MKLAGFVTAAMIALGAATLILASTTTADAQRPGVRCVHSGYLEGRWYCNVVRRTLGPNWRTKLRAEGRSDRERLRTASAQYR
jgi:hypothetical protein